MAVIMKNKAWAMYGGHSRGSDGFSLNGKTRFMSGGDRLGKSSRNTPTSDVLVKSSVMNTSGMLENRFKGILHGPWVKRVDVDLVRELKSFSCPVKDGVRVCGPFTKNMSHSTEEHLLKLAVKKGRKEAFIRCAN